MRIADLHCDTISYLCAQDQHLLNNNGQYDIIRAQTAGIALQFFALFTMPDDSNLCLRQILKQVETFLAEVQNSNYLYHLKSSSDLLLPENEDKIACLLHLEGGECLGRDVEILRILYLIGLRSMGLTWNYRNLLADGVAEGEKGGGLSRQGRIVIQEMEKLGIILDLAHINQKSYYEALDCYSKPILVSHANVKALCQHRRNLDDEQLRALAAHGGVVGVSQVADFIQGSPASVDDMLDHITYIAELVGVEHVALGSDFDGADEMVIKNVEGYKNLPVWLEKRGFKQQEIRMILKGNALRVIKAVI